MIKYITCIKCDVEQPVTNFIVMASLEVKTTCKSCKNVHKNVIKKLRKENAYPDDDYVCPICKRSIDEMSRHGQLRMKNWVLDHCHTTNTFRGWICHHCNTGLGGFIDSLTILENAIIYLRRHKEMLNETND